MEKDGEIVSIRYPMLTKSNYLAWSIKMKVCMCAQRIWDVVEPKDPKVPTEESKDQMALAAIYQGIPEDMLFLVYGKETAKETWEALKIMHMGAKRVKDAKVQALKSEFEGLCMKESESIDSLASRLTTIVNQIRALDEDFEETYADKKFLRAVTNKFLQIASAIEQFCDLKTMTMEEVIGRLKAHEERLRGSRDVDEEHLLLTRAEWKARHEAENSSQGRGRGGRGGGRGRACGKSKMKFYNCPNFGHYAYECLEKKRKGISVFSFFSFLFVSRKIPSDSPCIDSFPIAMYRSMCLHT
jgi:hypothetical protein